MITSAQSENNGSQLCYITYADEEILSTRISQAIAHFKETGAIIEDESTTRDVVLLDWPLQANNYEEYNYYETGNYADTRHHFNASTTINDNTMLDYMCGDKLYNDHNGWDIGLHPFGWQMMDDERVAVVAAADGLVIDTRDGAFDRNSCEPYINPGDPWGNAYGNYVVILHSDNSIAIYGHMKQGILVDSGQTVATGQHLGFVGSSGNSGGPHLHFELRDPPFTDPNEGDSITVFTEPSSGPCNPGASRWLNQHDYFEPAVLRLITHSAQPDQKNCTSIEGGENENLNKQNHFNAFDPIVYGIYIRDFLENQTVDMKIYKENSSSSLLSNSWTYSDSDRVDYHYIPSAVFMTETATYQMKVNFNNQTYVHYFTVGCPPSYNLNTAHVDYEGFITGGTITSSSIIAGSSSNNVFYEAESGIQLNPGFFAVQGCTFKAQIDDCTVGGTKTAETFTEQPDLNIFPNPASTTSTASFKMDRGAHCRLYLTDISGKEIAPAFSYTTEEAGTHEVTIPLNDLAAGIYFVVLESNNFREMKKLIVQR